MREELAECFEIAEKEFAASGGSSATLCQVASL